ncbi:MAG: hypothetical protein AUJ92_03845 [Armatimonadetes bacterium CG2_30_59_28]|nr:zinc-binding dehydrogenase [Armatimonadota bacterium]OIO97382.1 MAG: hypothetical protein AUJ92_03845 [Armatimonadetes bacterium CG2_30_59_28]PIU61161.1 MAG: hypothetical protein COS85_21660 [Armatimonadetes bacterium CG07_land_8_20_14_0_80_59_28]PIX46116.1 MAG: hypothetical protein COZ56_00250 [Armatimonadetes bacterium CG_4_8_14_3_um_filter_58_9]PIY43674.1 MAG: hypothetical protein COZ05_10330 [Armatimonadetes bacterium CG_4_10_14_3_um_filter_59_10]
MKAALNVGPHRFEVREVPVPDLAEGEVLVRVKATGICGSDKHEFSQARPPRIAGHEFAGIVEASTGTCFQPGDRVVADPITPAGVIGYSRPGGFAEYCAVPAGSLFSLPEKVSFAEGSLTEPVAVGLHAASRLPLDDRSVLVLGAGCIGLLVAQACRVHGAREVWVADISDTRLSVATQLGFTPINSQRAPELSPLGDDGVDVVFECVGHVNALLQTALRVVRVHGEIVLLGSGHSAGLATTPIVDKQLTIRGSTTTNKDEMREALERLVCGDIAVAPLISDRFPLDQMNAAFAASLQAQKIVVQP